MKAASGYGRSVANRSGRAALEPQQRVWIADRERLQDHEVEEAEGRDVDADADRQRRHRRDREARCAAQRSRGVAQVLAQPIEPRPSPGVTGLFPQPQRVSEPLAAVARGHLPVEGHLALELAFEA